MIRLLIVDDSVFVRKVIRRVLQDDPEIQVIGEAENGRDALDMIPRLRPHVVALDIDMPGLDGYGTLVEIMKAHPRPVLMMSMHTHQGSEIAEKCLRQGAAGCLDKSNYGAMDYHQLAFELRSKILEAVATKPPTTRKIPRSLVDQAMAAPPMPIQQLRRHAPRLIVVGASTGGPPLLQEMLSSLPEGFPVPVIVVQHMPAGFTGYFAQRLDAVCKVEVSEARAGDVLKAGRVLVAPAGKHLRIGLHPGEPMRALLSKNPTNTPHIPSIDETMMSVAAIAKAEAMGILLTGMGSDGAHGLLTMRGAGALTVVQDPETCVAAGMPRAALERGAVERVLDPVKITALLLELAESVGA